VTRCCPGDISRTLAYREGAFLCAVPTGDDEITLVE